MHKDALLPIEPIICRPDTPHWYWQHFYSLNQRYCLASPPLSVYQIRRDIRFSLLFVRQEIQVFLQIGSRNVPCHL